MKHRSPGAILALTSVAVAVLLPAAPALGQTLLRMNHEVVDTTNFTFNNQSRFGVGYLDGMTDQNLHVVERFTRTDADTILYQATINDPTVYTNPWTVEISMTKREDHLFEYACNEGNYGMFGILSGARAEEKKAAEKR